MNVSGAKKTFVTRKEFDRAVCCLENGELYLTDVVSTPVGGGVDLTFTLNDGTVIGPINVPTGGSAQTLSFTDPDLTISSGNTVDISDVNYWDELTGDLTYVAGNVGIGTIPFVPTDTFHVESGNIRIESGSLLMDGATSGQLTISAPAVSGTNTITWPAATGTVALLGDIVGGDTDAIHDNVAGEINSITEKLTPVVGDWILIEDSAAANVKKKIQIGNLPGIVSGFAIGDPITGGTSTRVLYEDGLNQVAESADFQWTGTALELNRSTDGDFDLWFGLDDAIHKGSGGEFQFIIGGTTKWRLDSNDFGSQHSTGGHLDYQTTGITDPYVMLVGDEDTGVSGDNSNALGLVAGGSVGVHVDLIGAVPNVELFGSGGSYGGGTTGVGVLRYNAATTIPTGLVAGGGITYVTGNELHYLAADGTDHNLTQDNLNLPVSEIVGTSQTMVANNAYIANNVALVTLTLPTTCSVGDRIRVIGKGAGLWKVAQPIGVTTYFGDKTTTTGASGSLDSQHQRDVVTLVCVTANTEWQVESSIGNITTA